ncbi:hypothetical protein QBC35DRAFT_542994, partial [Podospora australis]
MGSLSPPKRVLLLTNSEHGQANVFLATSYALLTLSDEDVEVHFASFSPIKSFVDQISSHAQRTNNLTALRSRSIIFHTINGIDMVSAWSRPELDTERGRLKNHHLLDAIRRMAVLLKVTLPWTGDEFVQIMQSVIDIVHRVRPDVVAADPVFSPAVTALRYINAKFLILSPNTIKDFAMPFQPNGEALWKYPCTGTPHTYPLPPHLIPQNMFLILLSLLLAAAFDAHRGEIQSRVSQHYPGAILTTLSDLSLRPHVLKTKFLVANLSEIEFPLKVIPSHIIPCGPLLRPAIPIGEADPALAEWLHRGPTVYINLGTHLYFNETFSAEMAKGVRILLDHQDMEKDKEMTSLLLLSDSDFQGPWMAVRKILGNEIYQEIVKIVEWIEAEPTAVLESGRVVCAVHHGGANSFMETVSAGIPQVVLPLWMDTYDFARRAELLGIGRWGNQGHIDQMCDGKQLGDVLIDVVVGGRWSVYAENAKKLADICHQAGGGRAVAGRFILDQI